jgi:hypothetical protein
MLLSMACLALAVVSIPMILGKVPANSIYGFRTKRTLSSPDIWYPANTFSGWALLFAAVFSLATLWFLPAAILTDPWIPLATILVPLGVSAIASFPYLRRFS